MKATADIYKKKLRALFTAMKLNSFLAVTVDKALDQNKTINLKVKVQHPQKESLLICNKDVLSHRLACISDVFPGLNPMYI